MRVRLSALCKSLHEVEGLDQAKDVARCLPSLPPGRDSGPLQKPCITLTKFQTLLLASIPMGLQLSLLL